MVASSARAQFSVQPVIVELTSADTAQTVTVTLTNEGKTDLQFRFYAGDFDQDSAGEHTFMRLGAHPKSCASRLRVAPDGVVLKAGERQPIRIRMEPGAGTCWSLVFAEAAAPSDGPVRIAQRIAIKTYGVDRTARRDGEITQLQVAPATGSVELAMSVSNTGDAPIRPHGKVEVRAPDGRVLRATDVDAFSVLPGKHRRLGVTVPGGLPPGEYLVVPVLDFGGEYLIGAQTQLRIR